MEYDCHQVQGVLDAPPRVHSAVTSTDFFPPIAVFKFFTFATASAQNCKSQLDSCNNITAVRVHATMFVAVIQYSTYLGIMTRKTRSNVAHKELLL